MALIFFTTTDRIRHTLNMARVGSFLLSLSSVFSLWLSVKSTEALVTWPEGTYGLPKAKTGCPVSAKTEWTTGWLYEDTEDNNPRNYKSRSFHLDATVALDINRTFCMKVKNNETTEWPAGKYCILKKEDCPKGFREGSIFWDDENNKNINKNGGTLPDGVYNSDTLIFYCCRTDGDKLKPVSLPVISPFYLKAFDSPECQRVEGAVATEEFIRFDNEDTANKDTQNGSFPYGAGISNHNLSYCYYENCDYTYSLNNNAQIEFSSPNFRGDGYPLAQKCTWQFVAPETGKIHISLLEVEIEEGDFIDIKDGWKSGEGIATIQKSKPPNPDGYRSQSHLLFIEFQSASSPSSRKRSKGFRAIFTDSWSKKARSSAPEWPSGTFGLPRTSLGCPHSDNITWSTGWRFQDTEDNRPSNYNSYSFHMDASVMKNDVNRSFCIATKNDGTKKWPKGQYCIYKKGACPEGFTEGSIFFDDENIKNRNKVGGVVPDGVYNKDTKIFYCCRADGNTTDTISLPAIVPFYLMAFNRSECQQVRGAMVTKEFIRYDNEDQNNKDELVGTHAYAIRNLIIGYCYYEVCHYTISEKSQAFSSPNYHDDRYPNSQVCTWRFLVQKETPQNEQILIKFPEFDLQKGKDGDVVRIYSGWDDKAPLLAEFNGDNPPPAEGVASDTPVVYLMFSSDSRRQSRGFQGLFVNQAFNLSEVPKQPITLPGTKTTTLTTRAPIKKSPSTRQANITLNVSTQLPTKQVTTSTEPPIAAKGKQTGTQSSSSPAKVIVPVLVVVILVAALIGVYYIRRRRNEARIRKAINRSQTRLVDNGDLNSQEYDSNEELQEIFPLG